ncbi:MAG: hypothetical protein QF506_01105 [Candidatus Woesearchaeota archaeon]|nr:hypothetical protein [Candidatus Woesearchaeota archaeon]
MLNRDDVLKIVERDGPLIPVQIGSELKTSIIMAAAVLSELASENMVKISNLKIGGSPLYYVKGQEEKLQGYSNKLHEKEKKSYDLLKEKEVLRDSMLEPIDRVALRQIKDFAVPLNVNYKGVTETFWKWYLLSNQDVEELIRKELNVKKEKKVKETKENRNVVKEVEKKEIKPDDARTTSGTNSVGKKEAVHPVMKERSVKKKVSKLKSDEFLKNVLEFFKENDIKVVNQNVIRKNNDIEFLVELSSSVGNLAYFCKAKNKKKINEGDLSTVYIQAQSKKLPALFLTTGDVTKKAKMMLNKEFKGMQIKGI